MGGQQTISLSEIVKELDSEKIAKDRDYVLSRFRPQFQMATSQLITEKEFGDFLKVKHNRHWSSLERQKGRLLSNMQALRSSVGSLVDEMSPLNQRYQVAISSKGMGRALMTAILLVAYPDRYGVWNSTSERGLRAIGRWPRFKRGMSEGQKYVAINGVLNEIADELGVDLWTLDTIWWDAIDRGASDVSHRQNDGRVGRTAVSNDGAKGAARQMARSIIRTVAASNGQQVGIRLKNKATDLTERELERVLHKLQKQQKHRCALTGLRFQYGGSDNDEAFLPSPDRIDSSGHYVDGNIQIVCRFVNFWKGSTPDARFRELLGIVRDTAHC